MHGFLVDEFLKKVGMRSSILFSPPFIIHDIPWEPADQEIISDHVRGGIVFFQKLQGPNTEALVRRLKQDGTLTVYSICDYLPENQIPLLCDAVVCSSEDLADYYRGQGCRSVTYIPDPAEFWCLPERAQFARPISRGLKVCWVGGSRNWPPLEPLLQLFQEDEFRDFQLITISDHPQATLPWSPETVRRVVPECDLAVIPTGSTFAYQVKSSNRALLFMANGVPVVASPLRSYSEVIRHSWNGFLVHDLDGFRAAFRELRDMERRKSIAWNAYSSIAGRYDIDAFGGRWKTFFESLHGAGWTDLGESGTRPKTQRTAHPGGGRTPCRRDCPLARATRPLPQTCRAEPAHSPPASPSPQGRRPSHPSPAQGLLPALVLDIVSQSRNFPLLPWGD